MVGGDLHERTPPVSVSGSPSKSKYSPTERAAAVDRAATLMREEGYSQNKATDAVGDDLGVTGRTVKLWAVDLGMPLGVISQEDDKTAKAREALVEYGHERRRQLSDLLFGRIEDVALTTSDPGALKDLATTYGILVDKRRLEEGKATERTETVDQRSAVERAKQKLTSIAGGRAS